MALDMNTHGNEIRKAVDEVASDSGNDWCIIGYEGKTHTLYVHGQGDGGLDEMVDEFHGSKIMYGYVRVKEPNTGLPKFVFINWQGEGAPERMKFNCSSHSVDVQRLCRPVHVTVNARDESDLEPNEIVNKVVKAAGSQFSVLKSSPNNAPNERPVIAQKPKGSVYQKSNATAEILNRERDAYWQKLEREEAQQKQEEARRKKEEKAREERERREREEREAQGREQRTAERARKIAAQRSQEQRAGETTKAAVTLGAMDDVEADERERRSRRESIKNERQAELQALLDARKAAGLQPSQKVSSSYQKVDPRAELASLQRDKYWGKLEEDEKRRKEEEAKRSTDEASQREQQRIAREEADAKRREEAERERAQGIARQRAAEQRQAAEADRKRMEALARAQHREATEDEEERSSRSERLRKERQEEAARLIAQRGTASALRARFQDGGASQQPPTPPAPAPTPAPVQQYQPPTPAPVQQYQPPTPVQQYEPPTPTPVQQYQPPTPAPVQQYEPPTPVQQYEPPQPQATNPSTRSLPALPPEELSNTAPESSGWTAERESAHEPADNYGADYGVSQAEHPVEGLQPETSAEEPQHLYAELAPQEEYQQEVHHGEYQQEVHQEEYQQDVHQEEYQREDYAQGDHGVCAEALYDYTAAEEDEVSFNPGDIISEIEQIDEGWWTGVTSDGHRGLFPSNYVRLI